MGLEIPGATRGVEHCVISRFWEFDQGGAWVVQEPYNVASKGVEWLLDFTKLPETIIGVVPDGKV